MQAEFAEGMRAAFAAQGHEVQSAPDDTTDLLFAFARFGEPLSWREAPFLQARRMYRLQRQPTVVMILNVGRDEWERLLRHLDAAIRVELPDPRTSITPAWRRPPTRRWSSRDNPAAQCLPRSGCSGAGDLPAHPARRGR